MHFGIDTDVALVLGSQRIRAHRFALAQGCTYLRSLMYPIRGNEITLDDCDYKATLTVVRFFYAHECFMESNDLQDVSHVIAKHSFKTFISSENASGI